MAHAGEEDAREPPAGNQAILILERNGPWRAAILPVAGDKSGQWSKWNRTAIPRAERSYNDYLAERRKETGP
jgi:hypothetical protein